LASKVGLEKKDDSGEAHVCPCCARSTMRVEIPLTGNVRRF